MCVSLGRDACVCVCVCFYACVITRFTAIQQVLCMYDPWPHCDFQFLCMPYNYLAALRLSCFMYAYGHLAALRLSGFMYAYDRLAALRLSGFMYAYDRPAALRLSGLCMHMITRPHTSVPAGVYLFPNPRQRFALRIWPGTIQVSRSR